MNLRWYKAKLGAQWWVFAMGAVTRITGWFVRLAEAMNRGARATNLASERCGARATACIAMMRETENKQ